MHVLILAVNAGGGARYQRSLADQSERELDRAVSLSAIAAATARLEPAPAICARAVEVAQRDAQRAA